MGKILLDSAASIEKWQGVLVLWGGVFFALLFVSTPLADTVVSTLQLLPWWTVPVFLLASLAFLFVRGLLKANYEEFRKIEHERDELKTEYEAITQQPLAPVNEDLRQRCCRLSAKLSELIGRWRNAVEGALQPGMMASVRREIDGDPDGSLEIKSHDNWLMEEYDEQFSDKVLRLSDELAWHRCITPETRKGLESPESPKDVRHIAQRLKLICDEPDSSSQEYRRDLIKSWREAIESYDHAEGNIRDTATYSAMRPHLKQEIRERLENPRELHVEIDDRSGEDRLAVRGQSPSSVKNLLLDEVTRLEQEWGLV